MPIHTDHLDRMSDAGGRPEEPTFCTVCGYNLKDAVSKRCPECGHFIVAKEWEQQKRKIKAQASRIEDTLLWVGVALKVAGVVFAIRVFVLLPGTPAGLVGLSRLASVLCGVGVAFLGLGAFRVGSLPDWAQEKMNIQPKPNLALGAVLAGLALIAAGAFSP